MQSNRMSKRFLILGMLAAAAALPALGQPVLTGEEMVLSEPHRAEGRQPVIGFHASGAAVAVWENQLKGLLTRGLNASGQAAGQEWLLVANDPAPLPPFRGLLTRNVDPELLTDRGAQGFLLFWTAEVAEVSRDFFFGTETLRGREVMVQRFEQGATPVGSPLRVSAEAGLDSRPAAAWLQGGDAVVVWNQRLDRNETVLARRVGAGGDLIGEPFAVGAGARPDVAALADGGFLVVWEGCCDAGSDLGVFARRFDAAGEPIGDAFAVNATAEGNQRVPQVAVGPTGRPWAVWQGPQDDAERVFARTFDRAGQLAGAEIEASAGAFGDDHSSPTLATGPGNRALLVWMSWFDGFRDSVWGRFLDDSAAAGAAFQINQRTIDGQFRLGLASDGQGRHLVAWQGFDPDGEQVVAGRFVTAAAEGPQRACTAFGGQLPFDLVRQRVCR